MVQSSIAEGRVGRRMPILQAVIAVGCLLSLGSCAVRRDPAASILIGGDVLFDRGSPSEAEAADLRWDTLAIAARRDDAFLFNLETAIGSGGAPQERTYVFRSPPTALAALRAFRRPVAGLANNHAMDYGAAGLLATLASLDAAGVARAGAGIDLEAALTPARVELEGARVYGFSFGVDNEEASFAGADRPGIAPIEPRRAAVRIAAARGTPSADSASARAVVAMLHWGAEYSPSVAPRQRSVARALVDAGADAVVGSGPHVLQGIEWYRGSPILYSLGNLVFDDVDDPEASAGLLARLLVYPAGAGAVRKRLFIAPLRTESAAEGPRAPNHADADRIALSVIQRSPSPRSAKLGKPRSDGLLLWYEVKASAPAD